MLEIPTCTEVQKGEVIMKDFDGVTVASFWNYLLFMDLKYALNSQLARAEKGEKKAKTEEDDVATIRITELALNLLILGDKYEMSVLKRECLEWLKWGMRATTVLRVIKVANMARAQELVQDAIDFVFQHRFDENLQPAMIVQDDMPKEITSKIMEMFLNAGPKTS